MQNFGKSNSYRFWKFWAWKIKRHFRKVLGTSKLSDSCINFFFLFFKFTILILPSIFKATDCNRNDTHNTISICLLFVHVKESSIGILLTLKSVWRKFLLRILIVLLFKKNSLIFLFLSWKQDCDYSSLFSHLHIAGRRLAGNSLVMFSRLPYWFSAMQCHGSAYNDCAVLCFLPFA